MRPEDYRSYSLPGRILFRLGQAWLESLPGKLLSILFIALRAFFTIDNRRFRTEFRQIILQAYFTGIEAIPLISLVAVLLGTLTITQAVTFMPKVGFGDFFGNIMVIVIVRELGPVLTAFLVAGRTGAALASYLGSMKVESEVDALETMGIDPIKYLVMPAVIGAIIALFILNLFFSVIAIVVGFISARGLVSLMQDMGESTLIWSNYIESILMGLTPMDFAMAFIKPIIFGAIIAVNASYCGMSIKKDQREVPKATSKSVVYSFIFVVLSDLMLSLAYILEYLRGMRSLI